MDTNSSHKTGKSIKRFFSNAQSLLINSNSTTTFSRTLPAVSNGNSTFYAQDPSQAGEIVRRGWLKYHVGGRYRPWVLRWFVLAGEQLFYYSTEDESKPVSGHVYLPGYTVNELPYSTTDAQKFLFEIIPVKKEKNSISIHNPSYLLCADNEEDRKDWIYSIKQVLFGKIGGAIFGRKLDDTLAVENSRRKFTQKVPEIVEMCVEFLYVHGLDTEGLFRLPGRSTVVKQLRGMFDTGSRPRLSLRPPSGDRSVAVDVHSVASLLKSYLRELPDPLIPFSSYQRVMHIVQREFSMGPDNAIILLTNEISSLPVCNINLLKYLCQFLFTVSEHSDVNRMNAMNLATVFSQSFIRPEVDDPALLMGTSDGRAAAVFVLVSQSGKIFPPENQSIADNNDTVHNSGTLTQSSSCLITSSNLDVINCPAQPLLDVNADETSSSSSSLPTPDLIKDAKESPRAENKAESRFDQDLISFSESCQNSARNSDNSNNGKSELDEITNGGTLKSGNQGFSTQGVSTQGVSTQGLYREGKDAKNTAVTSEVTTAGLVNKRISRQTPLNKQQRSTRRTGMFFDEENSLAEALTNSTEERKSRKSSSTTRELMKRSNSLDELEQIQMSPRWYDMIRSSYDDLSSAFDDMNGPATISNCESLLSFMNSCELDLQSLSSYKSARQSIQCDSLPQEEGNRDEFSAIASKNPQDLDRVELVSTVNKLVDIVKIKNTEITKLTRRLRRQEMDFEEEISQLKRQVEEERDSRFVAVSRVVDIQTKLQDYLLRFGPLD